jgi:hypothetical protein
MIDENDRIPPRSKTDEVSMAFSHLHDEIERSLAQRSQRVSPAEESFLTGR